VKGKDNMDRLFAIGSACVVFVVCVLALSAGTKEEDSTQWGPETDGGQVSLKATQSKFRFDQPIALQIVVKNVGDKRLYLVRTGLLFMYRFDVRGPDGKPCPLTREGSQEAMGGANGLRDSIALDPGKSNVFKVEMLNRIYDMSLMGKYTVKAYRTVILPGKDERSVEMPSNKIEITVTEGESSVSTTEPATRSADDSTSQSSSK
jgi:hypothetical protein